MKFPVALDWYGVTTQTSGKGHQVEKAVQCGTEQSEQRPAEVEALSRGLETFSRDLFGLERS